MNLFVHILLFDFVHYHGLYVLNQTEAPENGNRFALRNLDERESIIGVHYVRSNVYIECV